IVFVVDGGSADATCERARSAADHVLQSARGRAQQMNAGAAMALAAGAEALLFLHVDCKLPERADQLIDNALRDSGCAWGRFDVRIEGAARMLHIIAMSMNWRSRLTGICTGDQAIFITHAMFERLRGFAPIALMEDIEFSKRANAISRPIVIRQRVTTSSRRWQRHGIWRTILLMWRFRLAYFFGADPQRLADRYRDAR
ncbi:MAG: TIGR04283 family arsenosugar biosynthesis glycosyltransferase, partial [Burkholderiaceae bacterium]